MPTGSLVYEGLIEKDELLRGILHTLCLPIPAELVILLIANSLSNLPTAPPSSKSPGYR